MKVIKLDFDGFWSPFDKEDNYFTNLLRIKFDVVIDKTSPDYLICSCFNPDYSREGIKIFFTGENLRIDFNRFDYGIGFDYMTFGDRYIRWPVCNILKHCYELIDKRKVNLLSDIKNKGFCSLVTSNVTDRADPMREVFFKRLCEYKKVDSGGKALNNIGGSVSNKMEFIEGYKFNIAIENSSGQGYTTEKIIESYAANTLPIYYGNPLVHNDFNMESMIYIKSYNDIDMAVEKIIELDCNDDLYLEKLNQPPLLGGQYPVDNDLLDFFGNIFNKSLSSAKMVSGYGFNPDELDSSYIDRQLRRRKFKDTRKRFFCRK